MVKSICVIKRLNVTLPYFSLLTIYKLFIRPHLYHGDVIYDQTNNNRSQKLEYIQYNAALAIADAIRGTSRQKLYQELGLEKQMMAETTLLFE